MNVKSFVYCQHCHQGIELRSGLCDDLPHESVRLQRNKPAMDYAFCDIFCLYRYLDEKRAEFEEERKSSGVRFGLTNA